jgi:hypothetical protein
MTCIYLDCVQNVEHHVDMLWLWKNGGFANNNRDMTSHHEGDAMGFLIM